MAKNEKKDNDIRMDEFLSDDASNIAVEDFAIEADESGTFPEDRRAVEIMDYSEGTSFDNSSEDKDNNEIAEKGKHLVHRIFNSSTGRISVYVFLALNVVAIISPFIIERMEAKRRRNKWWNFKF